MMEVNALQNHAPLNIGKSCAAGKAPKDLSVNRGTFAHENVEN